MVSVCRLAFDRLEPAGVVWGVGEADLAVNRRERAEGTTILGWNPDNLVDNQVTVLQARRPDEAAIATAVAFGCHPVTTGFDMVVYSADFPGPLREMSAARPAASASSSRPPVATSCRGSHSPPTSGRRSGWEEDRLRGAARGRRPRARADHDRPDGDGR